MKQIIEQLAKKYPNLVTNLSEAIYSMDLNNYRNKSKRRVLGDSPWEFIPNVRSFSVTISAQDPLFKIFNIDKKLKPELTLTEYQNKAINRFIEHQIIRLKKLRMDKPKIYWWTAHCLMKRSNSFRVLGINHTFKNWHRNYPLSFIVAVNRSCSKIINKMKLHVDAHRVYIPKGEKGYRPLGVPKPEWRLYLHMYQQFLTFFLQPRLHPNQHGFLPKKGTLTAWKQFFEDKVYEYKWIYEYDFKSFFDTVSLFSISQRLHTYGVPDYIILQLYLLNRNTPILPKTHLLDEERLILKASEDAKHRTFPYYYLTSQFFLWYCNQFPDYMTPTMKEHLEYYLEEGLGQVDTKLQPLDQGVAQGSATGPILANVVMDDWVRPIYHKDGELHTLAYADDSISYSNSRFIRYPDEMSGIEIQPKKCGWVKRNGKWLKPLKFLGMTFDGKKFHGDTRKGSKLELSPEMELLTSLEYEKTTYDNLTPEEFLEKINNNEFEEYQNEYENKKSWTKYFRSKLIGFAFSRIYIGKWDLGDLQQDFSLKFVPNSWMDSKFNFQIYPLKLSWDELDVFNSTSIACRSLLEIFRDKQKLKKPRKSAKITVRYIPSNLQKPEPINIDINRWSKYAKPLPKKKRDFNETRFWKLYYQNKPYQGLYPSMVRKEYKDLTFFTRNYRKYDYNSLIFLVSVVSLFVFYKPMEFPPCQERFHLVDTTPVFNGYEWSPSLIMIVIWIIYLLWTLSNLKKRGTAPMEFILKPDVDNNLFDDRTIELLSKDRLSYHSLDPTPFTGKSPQMMSGHFERWNDNLPDWLQ